MQQKTFEQNGVVYEDLGNGQVRVVGYRNAAPDPKAPYEGPQAGENLRGAQLQNQLDAATMEANRRKAEAEALSAERAARDSRLSPGQKKADEAFADRYAKWTADGGMVAFDQKLAQLDDVLTILQSGDDSISGPIIGRLPLWVQEQIDPRGPEVRDQVNKIVQESLKQVLDSQFAQREAEAVLARTGLNPTREEAVNESRIKSLIEDIRERGRVMDSMARHWEENGTISDWKLPPNASNKTKANAEDLGAKTTGNAPRFEPANGGTRSIVDPKKQAFAAVLGTMVNQRKSLGEMLDAAEQAGLDRNDPNLRRSLVTAIQHSQTPEYARWQRVNPPGTPYPVDESFYTQEVPMSASEKIVHGAANSKGGAATVAAANSVFGNYLDEIVGATGGDAETARMNMAILQQKYPGSSFLGDVAGQIAWDATLGKFAPRAGMFARNGVYGAVSGSGAEDEGKRWKGAALGSTVNAIGGKVGEKVADAGGALLRGSANPNLKYLYNEGVTPTPGMIARGSSGPLPWLVSRGENTLSGTPGFDGIINPGIKDTFAQFDRAAFRQMGVPDGKIGKEGLEVLGDTAKQAYAPLDSINLPYDATFAGQMASTRGRLANLPRFGSDIAGQLDTLDSSVQNGILSGRDWQSGLRLSQNNRSSLTGKEFTDQAVDVLRQHEDDLTDLAVRQGPPGTPQMLSDANRAYSNFKTMETALDNAPVHKRNYLIGPDRLDAAATQSRRNFGGRFASITDRPLQRLTEAGMDILPNRLPDSGTAGRVALLGGVAGALGGGGGLYQSGGDLGEGTESAFTAAAATTLPLMALYSPAGRRAVAKMALADRPQVLTGAIDKLQGLPFVGQYLGRRGAGMFGAAGFRDYAYLPEVPLG